MIFSRLAAQVQALQEHRQNRQPAVEGVGVGTPRNILTLTHFGRPAQCHVPIGDLRERLNELRSRARSVSGARERGEVGLNQQYHGLNFPAAVSSLSSAGAVPDARPGGSVRAGQS